MSDNSKLIVGLVIGAAAGAAIGILLTTDKGKEFLEKVKETAAGFEDELKSAVGKGKQMAEDLEDRLKQFTASA